MVVYFLVFVAGYVLRAAIELAHLRGSRWPKIVHRFERLPIALDPFKYDANGQPRRPR